MLSHILNEPATMLEVLSGQLAIILVIVVSATLVLRRLRDDAAQWRADVSKQRAEMREENRTLHQ